jgi:hypothetical protein
VERKPSLLSENKYCLVIRKEQMAAFERHAQERFICALVAQLLKQSEGYQREEIAGFVKDGIEVARSFSLTRETDVADFLEITWQAFGEMPEFPREALAILCTYTGDASRKLDVYSEWVEQELAIEDDDETEDGVVSNTITERDDV